MSSSFKPLYGEPDWTHRPYVPKDEHETRMSHFKNASYEENRLRAMNLPGTLYADLSKLSALSISEWGSVQQRPHTSSSATRQKTFIKWCRSPDIEILAGRESTSFKVPGDLILRRSCVFFDVMMRSETEEARTRIVRLPGTSSDTFEHVFVWLMSPTPSLDTGLATSVTLDIAIFATVYEMPSLLNQTIDVLWNHFSSSKDFWSPDLLERVYRNTTVDDLLREFTRASLPYINRPSDHLFKSTFPIEEWQDVFEREKGLGFDYFAMTQRGWTTLDFINKGSCSFHKHILKGLEASGMSPSLCKQVQEDECFEDLNGSEARLLIEDAVHERGQAQESPELSESHVDSRGEITILKSSTPESSKASDSIVSEEGPGHKRKMRIPVTRLRTRKPSEATDNNVSDRNPNGKRNNSEPHVYRG